MIIRTGASTVGVDVPPLILNKYFRFPVSAGLYIIDFFVILGQALYQPVDKVLYAILYVIIYTLVMNKLIVSGTSRIAVQIISKHSDEIRNFVLTQIDRGATIIPVQGGYLNQQLNMVLTVISNRELVQLEKNVHQIDPESFIIVSQVQEVQGRGFNLDKHWKPE